MIYPVLQKENLSNKKIQAEALLFTGECLKTAEFVRSQYGISEGDGYIVNIEISADEKLTFCEKLSKKSSEKYFIKITENKAVITAFSQRGVFRAVHTLMKLIEKNELFCGEIEDYPLFETRGYIEGFYGNTWEKEKRLSVMSLMAKYGMNTFYYAPKDDLYHRERWRERYPEKEYKELKELLLYATENQMDFCWCIGPGLTYHYSSQEDFSVLIEKLKSVYSLGVRSFGLLLDDIPEDFQYEDDNKNFSSVAEAHTKLVNNVYKELKKLDCSIGLTVCPTEYFGDESGAYISCLGKSIPSDINIFWTGQEICSRVLTCRECSDFEQSTNHKPLFWDNYPVNDCEMFNEMHLGAVKGRDKELYKCCEGLISNVMEYPECSKIPLMTIADYLWNPLSYDCENSLENAQREILGEKTEKFKYIADHLCVSCLNRYGGSALMSDVLSKIAFLNSSGKISEAQAEFLHYIEEMKACLYMLKNSPDELFKELSKWIEKFELCCGLLESIYATQKEPSEENKGELFELLQKYNRDAVLLTGFCLREAAEKALKL